MGMLMRTTYASFPLLLGLLLTACGGDEPGESTEDDDSTSSTPTFSSSPTDSAEETSSRLRFTVHHVCANSDSLTCPKRRDMPPPVKLEVTVPEGWQQLEDFPNVITPVQPNPTAGPDGAALLLGWTTFQVGVNSDPCLTPGEAKKYDDGHESPDVAVGPTVDDFVEAVTSQRALDVTKPVDARIGGHGARFFSLEGPDDLSKCELWRPWDPGIYAQGESNHWDVWAVRVDGQRVVFVAQHFPETPPEAVAQLREIVESIRFVS